MSKPPRKGMRPIRTTSLSFPTKKGILPIRPLPDTRSRDSMILENAQRFLPVARSLSNLIQLIDRAMDFSPFDSHRSHTNLILRVLQEAAKHENIILPKKTRFGGPRFKKK